MGELQLGMHSGDNNVKSILGTTIETGTALLSREVEIDVDRLIETRCILEANSGGGKSWALRRLLEQTHGKVQQIVIDVEDEFHTLRERFDYVLAGRTGGDCPAEPRSAGLLARRLLELRISAVVGIYELKAHDRIRFVRYFLEDLINAPKDLWHPVLVVIDEAHMFAPQDGKAESAQAVIDLMTRGRKRGFCGVLATQRPAALDKNASAQANNKLIGRFSQDIDVKRAAEDLGIFKREDQARLRTLKPGQFYAVGPAFGDGNYDLVQVGPVKTTHPRPGQRSLAPPPPKAQITAALARLADLPKEAEAELQTVADLKRRIQELEREAKKTPAPAVDPAAIEKAREEGRREVREAIRPLALALPYRKAREVFEEIEKLQVQITDAVIPSTQTQPKPPSRIVEPRPLDLMRISKAFDATFHANGKIAAGERKILTALAQYPEGRTKVQVALLTGYAHNGGGFNNYISGLRTGGYIERTGDRLEITQEGLDFLGTFTPLPTGQDLIEHWCRQVGKAERMILEKLTSIYPEALSKEDLGVATGYEPSGGGFNNALSRLRTLELIEGRGAIKASEVFFS